MKSKKISLLFLILMTALLWEEALHIPSRFAEGSQLADVTAIHGSAIGQGATSSVSLASDSVTEDFHLNVPATYLPAVSHRYLTSPVFVTDTQSSNPVRILSAPDPSASKAVLLSESHALFPKTFCLNVEYLPQNPELPTGCEAVALTTVLNYLGYPVTKFEIVDDYLPTGEPGKVDPEYAFPGSPYSQGGFGCYAPAIVKTANDYFADHDYTDDTAVDVSGLSVSELCMDYLYNSNFALE